LKGPFTRSGEAGSGVEAELRVRRRRPDVIVLDLLMPEMDGVELCRRLKSDDATRDIPIVLLTEFVEKARGYNEGPLLLQPSTKRMQGGSADHENPARRR